MNERHSLPMLTGVLAACLVALATGCGEGTVELPPPPTPVPTTITISPASATLQSLGETTQLTAEVRDQNGQTMANAAVAWTSSDPSVASVAASGLVTAAANGAVTVTATAGSVSGTAAVTVDQVAASVAVDPAADTLPALGDTLRLSAEALDANGNAVADAEFAWESSDPSVATVDATGLVTAAANGAATVTATAGSASGTVTVTVDQVVASVAVDPAADTLPALGDTLRLSAEALDANGNAVADAELVWESSDVSVATVNASGLVTAVGNGSTTVTVSYGSVSAGVPVAVEQQVASVLVSPSSTTLASRGDTVRLTAEGVDANANPVAADPVAVVEWMSDDQAVATVSATGLVTAVGNGSATVTVSYDRLGATVPVAVVDVAQFLEENSRIANAMVWLGTDRKSRPYFEWPRTMKDKLVLATRQLLGEGTELPDVMTNRAAEFLADDDYSVTVLSKEDAEDVYVANVAQSLILEMDGTLPWSLDDLSGSELELLLGWRGFFFGYGSDDVDFAVPSQVTGYIVSYGASPARPELIREFLASHDLVGSSRYETIIRTIDWARDYLSHFCGDGTAENYEDHWDHRGIPPLARMFVKTTREGNPYCPPRKTAYFTAGCGGTTWFFIHVLRAANIPVEDVDMPDSGHATPGFPSESLYLSHGDDPYSRTGWHSFTTVPGAVSLERDTDLGRTVQGVVQRIEFPRGEPVQRRQENARASGPIPAAVPALCAMYRSGHGAVQGIQRSLQTRKHGDRPILDHRRTRRHAILGTYGRQDRAVRRVSDSASDTPQRLIKWVE